jgi:hypothetical protein
MASLRAVRTLGGPYRRANLERPAGEVFRHTSTPERRLALRVGARDGLCPFRVADQLGQILARTRGRNVLKSSASVDSDLDQLDADCRDLHQINRITVLAMAVASGMSVANVYYCQPLLGQMGQSFGVGHAAGYIPAFTLIGLILGMVLLVPLGDMFERRRLIVASCAFAAVAAAAEALAPNFACLAIASLVLGTASIVQHLILPFAA